MDLSHLYFDPKQPGSFSGLHSFSHAIKNNSKKHKIKDVKKWIQDQEEYSLHKPIRKKYLRNKTISPGIDHIWQAD